MKFYQYHSLKKYNTFGLDVYAKYFVEYSSKDELSDILNQEVVHKNPLLVVGQGSNLLFLSDFEGVVIHSALKGITLIEESEDSVVLEVGSGVVWDDLVEYCVQHGWHGIENLSLIPGEVGASAIQNIGAYGVEIKDVLQKVKAVRIADGKTKIFDREACHYGYRQSVFKKELKGQYIILSIVIKLSKIPVFNLTYHHLEKEMLSRGEVNLRHVRDTIIAIRESKLPNPEEIGNAGSFFMNPIVNRKKFEDLRSAYPKMPHYFISETEEKISAAWLIDQCGWKGKRVGNAGVYAHQALVLVNYGNATGQEIADLAYQIQADVDAKFGIKLIPEVNFIS